MPLGITASYARGEANSRYTWHFLWTDNDDGDDGDDKNIFHSPLFSLPFHCPFCECKLKRERALLFVHFSGVHGFLTETSEDAKWKVESMLPLNSINKPTWAFGGVFKASNHSSPLAEWTISSDNHSIYWFNSNGKVNHFSLMECYENATQKALIGLQLQLFERFSRKWP